jgi:acyl-CoA synthetase (AMP-forming)/AMP-acid ligase II
VLACRTLFAGATLVTLRRFEVEGFLAALQDHRITQSVVLPPIVLALARHPAVDHYDLSALRWLACGPLPWTRTCSRPAASGSAVPSGRAMA